jgi:hypothetical protein
LSERSAADRGLSGGVLVSAPEGVLGLTIIAPADRDTLSNFSITVASPPDRTNVIVHYAGIKGNKPEDYGNTVALWDTLLPDPVLDQPLTTAPIKGNQQPGTVVIDWEFQATDYLVTYQTGKALTTMCASLELSPRTLAQAVPPNNVILEITCITATSVTVRYGTLAGYRPLTFQNWIGIWPAFPNPFRVGKSLGEVPIPTDDSEGSVMIKSLNLAPDSNYTLIYFMGAREANGSVTCVGSVVSFRAENIKCRVAAVGGATGADCPTL